MPPLITFEDALELGEITERSEIERLVERAWQVRAERFGDSTDMCSLVNAKSGGCAEDCGFCAQSRFAEAETPMHAMMSAEQILEHAKAAEAAGAHRFCMVTQGQGLSKRDFDAILDGARLVAEHTNLKRCASIGHMSTERAKKLREAGGGHAVVGGSNYGQGSSREHAVLAPRFLGLRVVLAKDIARIHWQNLVNYGVLPLTFIDPGDYDRLEQGDEIVLSGLHEALNAGGEITALVKGKDMSLALRHQLSARQIAVLTAGGLVNWIRESRVA
jgi:3-isopropylmalate dehydratase small subunit